MGEENYFECQIGDLQLFKDCLESVKFPRREGPAHQPKSQFNDVLLQILKNGMSLKAVSCRGDIVTECRIRETMFRPKSFKTELRDPRMVALREEGRLSDKEVLVEFCVPLGELILLTESMVGAEGGQDWSLQLSYPFEDNFLCARIVEQAQEQGELVETTTEMKFEVYQASFEGQGALQTAQNKQFGTLIGTVAHFKHALREFQFLDGREALELRFQQDFPFFQLVYEDEALGRFHCLKFRSDMPNLIYQRKVDAAQKFAVLALRQAFSRTSEGYMCFVNLTEEGQLKVQVSDQKKYMMIESVVLCQVREEEACSELF